MEKTLIRDETAWKNWAWAVQHEHKSFRPVYTPLQYPCVVFGMLDYQDGKWPFVYEFAYLSDFS